LFKYVSISAFLLLALTSLGQRKNDIIQQRIEFIAEDLELEDISLEDVFDVLYYYYDNPINLNTATSDDLHELLLLSDFQINELLTRIKQQGYFESVYELQEMDNWDLMTIDLVLPFIVVVPPGDEKTKKKGLIQKMRDGNLEVFGRWIRGVEEKAGYADVSDSVRLNSNQYYWGSPDRVYSRWRYTYGRTLSTGITMEKDPGEEIFGTTQPYGFDFYSYHFYYQRNDRIVRKIALGDYQMELGQGLAMWTGFAFNKTIEATKVRRNARGARAYTSVDETRFLRGAAVELERQGIPLLTDAAESLGALTQGRPAGSVGAAAALSFNGNKIITTSGGGALVTDEEAIARRVRHLATQAREPVRYYEHIDVGFNHRLSNVLAALGSSQLKTLAQRVDRRRAINDRYREGLSDVPWVHIADPLRDEDVAGGCAPTRWLTCLTISDGAPVDRDGLIDALEKEGIEARPVWKPMHLQPVYADAPHVGGQVAESAFARGVALPSGSGLDDGDIDRVVDAILSVG
jgi:hypothetical protein